MRLDKWTFKRELKELCEKCTTLKPSTAGKYANDLFNKFEGGCISLYTEKEYEKLRNVKDDLTEALNTLKKGLIESDISVLKLKDVSYVEFQEDVIVITTKNKQIIRYAKGFEYLKYVFKYNNRYF